MSETRMVYEEAEEMVMLLHTGAEQLMDTMEAMQRIAEQLDNGALLGDGGEAFSSALRQRLAPAIQRLAEKLKERSDYVQTEVYDMKQAEQASRNLF